MVNVVNVGNAMARTVLRTPYSTVLRCLEVDALLRHQGNWDGTSTHQPASS